MDDADVVMRFENVGIEVSSGGIEMGSFSILCQDGDHMVEIISDSVAVTNIRISFQHIQEMVKRDISIDDVTLLLVLADTTRLPRLHFRQFPQVQINHMIEYFLYKGLILPNLEKPNWYSVVPQFIESSPDVFDYASPLQSTAEDAVNIAIHNSILHRLMPDCSCSDNKPLTLDECSRLSFAELREQVFHRGLSTESRPAVWARILRIVPDTDDERERAADWDAKVAEYRTLWKQLDMITQTQKTQCKDLKDIFNTTEYDVERTDRDQPEFSDDNSPNLHLMRRILKAYGIFNHDTGFVQGMSDLSAPLIITFITEWKDDRNALFYDGVVRNCEEAEVFIFWGLVGLLDLTQQQQLLSVLGDNQFHVSAKVVSLVNAVHPPMKSLLKNQDLCQLTFIFSSLILMFKRDYERDDVFRLWDSVLTSDEPHIFPRYIAAAMLMFMYPKLLTSDKSLGAAMRVWSESFGRLNVARVLGLAKGIIDYVHLRDPQLCDFVSLVVPEASEFREFRSPYFELQKFP